MRPLRRHTSRRMGFKHEMPYGVPEWWSTFDPPSPDEVMGFGKHAHKLKGCPEGTDRHPIFIGQCGTSWPEHSVPRRIMLMIAGMSFEMIYAFVEDLRERTDIDFCARGVAPTTRSSLLAVARSAFLLVTRFGSICGARAPHGKSGSSWARALLGKA